MDMKIIRGTTPTLNFTLPFDMTAISEIILTFAQNGEKILSFDKNRLSLIPENTEESINVTDFNLSDVVVDEDFCDCSVKLTEEETLSFGFYPAAEKNIVYSQFKIYVELNGETEVFVSNPLNFRIYGDLDGEARLNKEAGENNL